MLAERTKRIGVSPTMKVAAEAMRLKAQGVDVVDLGAGEPDFPTPPHVSAAGHAAIDANFTKYTTNSGTDELKRAVCARYKNDYGVEYTPAETIITAGGKQALYNAAMCLFGEGDEVITPSFSFIASANCVLYERARPVFVDIDPLTGNMDPACIEAAITERTKAIIVVHAFGQPADMDPIMELARRHDLIVIEDACQAHGARYKGRRAGSLGHAAAFSFYPAKNLGAAGEGGAVVSNDPRIAESVRLLRPTRLRSVPGEPGSRRTRRRNSGATSGGSLPG